MSNTDSNFEADRATILAVDDMPENLVVLGELLQPHYRVRAVNNGTRALRAAASAPHPDLILLDVMMPDMDGYSVLQELQANPSTRDIPVIFVTAMDQMDDEERGLDLGAVDYITKPIRPAILLARVRNHLELKRTRDWLKDQTGFLESEVARRIRENQLIQDVSIRALANLAETRDWETGNHIRRTQAFVSLLANALRGHPRFAEALTPRRLELIVKAAPLHDIGKVGIPDQILLKDSRLTESEFEIMKTHSRLGADAIDKAMRGALNSDDYATLQKHCRLGFEALDRSGQEIEGSPLAFLEIAKEIALRHHEKWDGSGYPDGLAGEAIPVPARLMALADVFDALISRRVYKEPIPLDETEGIIVAGRGRHFDADVVDAFMALREEFAAVAFRYPDQTPPNR
ncbi:two-component system response regulator [Methylolobus aquaticus]|nr:two-component system response regulator [Methylolobus aquaticus]